MEWLLVSGAVVLAFVIGFSVRKRPTVGAGATAARGSRAPFGKQSFSWGALAVRGPARRVAPDVDDAKAGGIGNKLADNCDVTIAFAYVDANGFPSERSVLIDGIYGHSLAQPAYCIGLDSRSGERRTFRFDRMRSVRIEGGEPVDADAAHLVGRAVLLKAGLPLELPRLEGPLRPTLVAITYAEEGVARVYVGDAVYWEDELARLRVKGRWQNAKSKAVRERWFYSRQVNFRNLADGETGEVIDDLSTWLRARINPL